MKKKFISTAIALALGFSTQAFAETIRIDRAQIEQTSVLSTADLISNLTFQQGGTTLSSSINGGARGEVTASIHGMGARYTTILINGRRLVGQNSNSSANLNAIPIPLSLIDYIEVSSGGTLNGSGSSNVINIVTKKGMSGFEVGFAYATPQQDASGKINNFNLSKGFGDIQKDGYNLSLNYAHDEQRSVNAADRDFSKNGALTKFTDGGKAYSMYLPSSANQSANVSLFEGGISSLNPYLIANGKCPEGNLTIGRRCYTDYASNVDLLPSHKNTSLNAFLEVKINDDLSWYAEGLQSKSIVTAAYSYAVQPLSLSRTDSLFQNYVLPAYTALGGTQQSKIAAANANMRLIDAGRRTDNYEDSTKHFVTGIDVNVGAWNLGASYVHSESKFSDYANGGYLSKAKLTDLINTSAWNPFSLPSNAGAAALSAAVLHQEVDAETKKLSTFNLHASTNIYSAKFSFALASSRESLTDSPSAIAQGANPTQPNFSDAIIGGMYGAVPFDASRTNLGIQAEFNTEISKTINLSAGGRFDSLSAVKNNRAFDDNLNPINAVTQGSTQRASSFHIDASYRASDRLSIQGSYATGFRVPDLKDIAAPTLNAGYSGLHSFIGCQIIGASFFYSLKSLCLNDYTYPQEFQLIRSGNTAANGLKPEKISQYRVGFTLQPIDSLEIKASLWGASIKNQISMLTDDEVFANPMKYQSNFVAYLDPVLQSKVLAVRLTPVNRGSSSFQGIDFENTYRTDTSFGKISFNWAGTYTYMLKSTNTVNQKSEDYVGRFNSLGDTTFKLISKLTTVWQPTSRYTHSLSLNYKSGYRDMAVSPDQSIVRAVNADGSLGDYAAVSRSVKPYYTLDFQSKISFSDSFEVRTGIKNLFNQEPPFSVRNVGGGMGLGFDGRYTDPLGRQFYVVSTLKF